MTRLIFTTLAVSMILGCEKPPPKEPSPEHAECMAEFDKYVECKNGEADQLGELGGGKQIKRATKAQQRLASGSLSNCQEQLAKVADDPCAP